MRQCVATYQQRLLWAGFLYREAHTDHDLGQYRTCVLQCRPHSQHAPVRLHPTCKCSADCQSVYQELICCCCCYATHMLLQLCGPYVVAMRLTCCCCCSYADRCSSISAFKEEACRDNSQPHRSPSEKQMSSERPPSSVYSPVIMNSLSPSVEATMDSVSPQRSQQPVSGEQQHCEDSRAELSIASRQARECRRQQQCRRGQSGS